MSIMFMFLGVNSNYYYCNYVAMLLFNVKNNEKSLILYNGIIQRLEKDGTINVFKFDKTKLNLAGISTKSISESKMQETSTLKILKCIKNNYVSIDMHNF